MIHERIDHGTGDQTEHRSDASLAQPSEQAMQRGQQRCEGLRSVMHGLASSGQGVMNTALAIGFHSSGMPPTRAAA